MNLNVTKGQVFTTSYDSMKLYYVSTGRIRTTPYHYPQIATITTRTPAFWGYPPPPNDYPYHWVILDPKSKEVKVKVTNLKNSPKFWNAHYTWHLLKLLDKMCKYEMDPMRIVEDTERTRFCPQTDKRTDRRTDRRTRWYQYTPLSTSLKRGVWL